MSSIDRDALKSRLQEHAPRLRAYVASRVKTADTAADIAQEALLQALRHLDALRDPEKLGAWLKAIARDCIRRRGRAARERRWVELADQAEAARDDARGDRELFAEFDSVMRTIGRSAAHGDDQLIAGLQFCFDMTAPEIAAATGFKTNTIYKAMREVKARIREAEGRESAPGSDAHLKMTVIDRLSRAALFPGKGDAICNLPLMRQAHALARLTHAQYPREPRALYSLMMQCYNLAVFSTVEDSAWFAEGDFEHHRERWEPAYLKAAAGYYEELRRLNPPRLLALIAEGHYGYYAPTTTDAVDWRRQLEIFQEVNRLDPRARGYLSVARALTRLEGPLAAARYLEEFRSNKSLADDPYVYRALGKLYYAAGRWDRARYFYKKFLKWQVNPRVKTHFKSLIAECTERLRSVGK